MENQNTQTPELEAQEQESNSLEGHPLGSETCQRMFKAYRAVEAEDDFFMMTTNLLSMGHAYTTAMDMARENCHKQGKNRFSTNFSTRELMRAAGDEPDEVINAKAEHLFIQMINMFIDLHPVMSGMNTADYDKTADMMKVLYVTLVSHGFNDIFVELHTPEYIKPYLDKVLQDYTLKVDDIMEEWISYLEDNEVPEIVKVAKTVGMEFFKESKAVDGFKKYFQSYLGDLKNYDASYEKYLSLRDEFRSYTTRIQLKDLYPYFDINATKFIRVRKNDFIPEFMRMFSAAEYAKPLSRLFLSE